MAAAITARTGSGSVVKAKTAVHVEVTGAEANVGDTGPVSVTAASVANPTQLTTATAHGLTTGETVTLAGFDTTPTINGSRVVTVVDTTHFTVPVNVSAVTDGTGTVERTKNVAGLEVGTEKRYYLLVDAPAGVDDARSHVFQTSADGKHVWDDYIFPAAGSYTIRLRDMLDDSDVATLAVTVDAA
ncbi:MAG TPA: hypothetical protein VFX15_02855 [Actinomycetes bacterium]|nr:hypothetical protein [Actinomycetes bacterium]